VGVATVAGFTLVLVLLVLVTLLPYAVFPRSELSELRQPSMASALEAVVGSWGRIFVGAGLIVSVLGAYLAWSLIAIEVLFAAAKAGDVPRLLAWENRNGVPAAALWLSNAVIQVILILTLFSDDAFTTLVKLTSTMVLVPYLLSSLFALKLTLRRGGGGAATTWSVIATLFAVLMVIGAGLELLLLSALLYAPATVLFAFARRERQLTIFTASEWLTFAAILFAAASGAYGLATGWITI
jgi:arginine:ornithine antiporter/lysine permease